MGSFLLSILGEFVHTHSLMPGHYKLMCEKVNDQLSFSNIGLTRSPLQQRIC